MCGGGRGRVLRLPFCALVCEKKQESWYMELQSGLMVVPLYRPYDRDYRCSRVTSLTVDDLGMWGQEGSVVSARVGSWLRR